MSVPADTIAALATPCGTSAIAVIRASGPNTHSIATALCGTPPPPRLARRADYRTSAGQLVDDVLATWFKGPHSYTGEDVLEISCHGNPLIAQKILDDLLQRGCRLAAPGEFTQRAFLNEKLDLTQAEAVMDLIRASSDQALAVANNQLRGGLSGRIAALAEELLSLLAQVEAYIDFPEEDLPAEDQSALSLRFDGIIRSINSLIDTEKFRHVLDGGTKIVIVGPPNAGKSSLLNCLVGRNRALVSPEPGTTRDFIEDRLFINNTLYNIIDTAGIHEAQSSLEAQGIEMSLNLIHKAQLALLVLDQTIPPPTELFRHLQESAELGRVIVVQNKCDLAPLPNFSSYLGSLSKAPTIIVSTHSGAGVDLLTATMQQILTSSTPMEPSDTVTLNVRHIQALTTARSILLDAVEKSLMNSQFDVAASDLRESILEIERILAAKNEERVFDEIFATFCIGK